MVALKPIQRHSNRRKIAGCAPLIYFFYNYGKQSSVPESIDVAEKLYWYAVTNIEGPFDPNNPLSDY